ncbi:acyl-CoA acyltransferase [Bradyrhizobium sp. HKCCYLRH1073]|uniref:acyl-CoA acyltransferase n=1 Tax=unclassified Bradyrhizobium TaxID=2631580 RepID=UPI0028E39366|nr:MULTISPECIES: acyl-CoA acyltransferase [unclassified Bradyrhizobium]
MQPIKKAEIANDRPAPAQAVTGVRIREIGAADLPAVAALLTRGFAFRSEAYWLRGLERHAARPRPAGYPAFGYCLDQAGVPVGVILLLFSELHIGGEPIVRANVSSWYVEPAFRAFSSMLVRAATRDKTVTYFNITPAPHTWPQVEAQGFSVYCKGQVYAALALSRPRSDVRIEEFSEDDVHGLSPDEADLLRQHAQWGCLSLVAREADAAYPFVFQKHRVMNALPVYRLLYCRDVADLVRLAGKIGWLLLRRGGLLVRLDANGPIAGLAGWYSDKRGRKYAKGPHPPHLGDLAFTEAALFDG